MKNKVFEIPSVFAGKIIKKLESLKTQEEKMAELEKKKREDEERLVFLKKEEQKRRDEAIHEWFCNFFEGDFTSSFLKKIMKVRIFSMPVKEDFDRIEIELDAKTGMLFLVSESDFATFRRYNEICKYNKTMDSECLDDDIRDGIYKSILNGKIWDVVEKSLKEVGFLK